MPTVSLVCEGFVGQANTTAVGLGLAGMQLAMVPGHVDVQSAEELKRNVVNVTVDAVIKGLTGEVDGDAYSEPEPGPEDIVFS
ncbi:MAG TPA: UGSC family (seleno)protein, partial [Candidatus Binataceae bacterium]|nr:UGSC family (seleno)protein [Candidatus Binataceae bacterium]